jgi:hypothetical protein
MSKKQEFTKILETFKVSNTTTKKVLEEKLGRTLASPIHGKNEGEEFRATLTGEIVLSEYQGKKSLHLLTVEGYKVTVPANFDKAVHKEGAKFDFICKVLTTERDGKEILIKYVAFA